MKLKKQHIVIILIAALIVGFGGAYFGMKLAQPEVNNILDGSAKKSQTADKQPEDMDKIVQAYHLIKGNYLKDVKDKQLVEGAIRGMLQTLDDPYSTYMDAETMKQFNETIESSFEGIGAEVSSVENKVTIVAPIKDSPAEKAGLRPKDHVLSVDNESVIGMDLSKAVEKIRGKKGSEVVLEIERPGVSDPFDVTITRDDIPIETVYSDVKTIDGKKTGIIEITTFSENTADDFKSQLKDLENKGIKGLVIDVRGNPGGLLNVVQDILKQFIPKDMPMVQVQDGDGKKQQFFSELDAKKEYPISVLIDEGSASASEILAIAMKEAGYDIVGTKSFGKGTVQQAVPMGDGSTIKLTYFKWLSPNGKWIHEKGIKPTIQMKQPAYYYTNPIQVDKQPLTLDHTGEKIKNIQIMLKGLGYDPGREDGYFNKQTETAVQSFQKDNKINVTGKVDKKTAGVIETQLIKKIRSGKDDQQMKSALDNLY